jgi:hypothetical protein
MSGRGTGVAAMICVLLLTGCGARDVQTPAGALGEPAQSEAGAPTPSPSPSPTPTPTPTPVGTDDLRGLWGAGEDGGAEILYEFDRDGTFTRISLLQERRDDGTFKFQDIVEGTFRLDDGELTLRPTAGTQTVDDPRSGDGPVSTRKTNLAREVHSVEMHEGGTVLVLTPEDGAPLTLARQQG